MFFIFSPIRTELSQGRDGTRRRRSLHPLVNVPTFAGSSTTMRAARWRSRRARRSSTRAATSRWRCVRLAKQEQVHADDLSDVFLDARIALAEAARRELMEEQPGLHVIVRGRALLARPVGSVVVTPVIEGTSRSWRALGSFGIDAAIPGSPSREPETAMRDNDGSGGALCQLPTERLVQEIDRILAEDKAGASKQGETVLVPSVAILDLLCMHLCAAPPKPEIVIAWRDAYLAVFDRTMPGLDPTGTFLPERRSVVEATFASLETQAREFWRQT
jgi:hypothetical protein